MNRVLITGGAGFVGSHLCKKLLDSGNEVICLDNYFTGSKQNIVELLDNPYFELIRHDITMPIYLEVDQIYNLACPASPQHYQNNGIKTIKSSVMGSINVLGMAKRLKVPILQASTSEVYGDPQVHPQQENYWGNVNPIGVRSCYDEGKRCAESLFMNYHIQNGVDITIARIFNTYGPKMGILDGRVISNFIGQALKGDDITIYGDGTQTRSFQYVDDLVDGLILSLNRSDRSPLPINLGNPTECTIIDLAKQVIELTGSKSKIVFVKLPEDDPFRRQPDISYANRILDGWKPKIELKEGLIRTINSFEKNILIQ